MNPLNLNDVVDFVEANIGDFHQRKLENLKDLKLIKVLKRKNPYLFKAKNILTAQDLVKGLMDAHLSSQEETIFGAFLEELAIFVCSKVYDGKKSTAEGIDLEFEKDRAIHIMAIKSGPNWGNSSQVKRMKDNFKQAQRRLRQNKSITNVVAVNGCCYGRDNKPDKGEYQKLCGQRFWEFISGKEQLYLEIIEPLGHKAKEKNEEFHNAYAQILNLFTQEFMNNFCQEGVIEWEKLVQFNSSTVWKSQRKKK
jgi:poly(3-hydroxybutyrate) depolymerase